MKTLVTLIAAATMTIAVGAYTYDRGATNGYEAGWLARMQFDQGHEAPANYYTWHETRH